MIYIDANEPKKVLRAFEDTGIPYEVKALKIGDFTNEKGTFVAERKSLTDFWASMTDNRLNKQMNNMYETYSDNRYLFIEWNSMGLLSVMKYKLTVHPEDGEWGVKTYENWIYSQFGMIENYGIKVREYNNLEDLARKLDSLDKFLGAKKILREIPKRLSSKIPVDIKMLMQLGGVGKKKAKDMIKICGDFVGVIKDLVENNGILLATIKGIAPLPKGKILTKMLKAIRR